MCGGKNDHHIYMTEEICFRVPKKKSSRNVFSLLIVVSWMTVYDLSSICLNYSWGCVVFIIYHIQHSTCLFISLNIATHYIISVIKQTLNKFQSLYYIWIHTHTYTATHTHTHLYRQTLDWLFQMCTNNHTIKRWCY